MPPTRGLDTEEEHPWGDPMADREEEDEESSKADLPRHSLPEAAS